MKKVRVRFVECAALLVGVLMSAGSAPAQEYTAPVVSAVNQGSYTVSYVPDCGMLGGLSCVFTVLQERLEPGGQWKLVSTSGGSFAVSGQAPGAYSYRVHVGAYVPGANTYLELYSASISVTVDQPPVATAGTGATAATRDNLLTQLAYDYRVRQGDINGDGRLDFLLQKLSGTRNNGTIDDVLLRQKSDSRGFDAVVPTAAQLSVAGSWAESPVQPRLNDINVDGYADITLSGVSALVSGATDQLVYAPGRPGRLQPIAVKDIDDRIIRFVENTMDYFADQDYFWENAPQQYYVAPIYHAYCYGPNYTENYYYDYSQYLQWLPTMYACFTDIYYHVESWRDYSAFSPEALNFWVNDYEALRGTRDAEVALREVAGEVEELFGAEIGGWPMEEVLGIGNAPVDWLTRRGIEVVQSILGQARGSRDRTSSLLVPPQIDRVPDQIYITGHPLQFAKSRGHLAVEYTNPLGSGIPYVGETFSGGPERNSMLDFGKLISETSRPSDHPLFNYYVGDVDPLYVPEHVYWESRLRQRHESYRRLPRAEKVDYALLPNRLFGTYNSNGYISGITRDSAANVAVSAPSVMGWNYPGWNNPVPDAKFR